MPFEYDPAKSSANKDKHGIDFEKAQAMWNDPQMLDIRARHASEARVISIGMIGGRHWTAVWTDRGGIVRIISVRRARKEEVKLYEGA